MSDVMVASPETKSSSRDALAADPAVIVSAAGKVFPSGNAKATAVHALGPVSIELRKGEFFSVIGPSGCGKSTLLELIAGLTAPSSGEVTVNGRSTSNGAPRGIGVVFQEDASFPWLNVHDNIAFGLQTIRISAAEAKSRIDAAIELMGLQNFRNAYPAQLSGGMRQRVCIARTLVMQPSIILLDEPFGALDQQTRILMGDELLKLWRATGATVLLITHSLDEAALLSDRVGVMSARPGRFLEIVETGWPAERTSALASDPEFGRISTHLWSLLREQSMKSMTMMSAP
jgi:NitT/TauT family transport system ATP-binding protein